MVDVRVDQMDYKKVDVRVVWMVDQLGVQLVER